MNEIFFERKNNYVNVKKRDGSPIPVGFHTHISLKRGVGKAYAEVEASIPEIGAMQGTLCASAESLKSALDRINEISEKAVKNALREMKEGKFEVYLPEEEGYENAVVDVVDYVEPKEEFKPFKLYFQENKEAAASTGFSDFDSTELMGADEVFTNEEGFSVADAEDME